MIPSVFHLRRLMEAQNAYGQACRAGADALTAWWQALHDDRDGAEELRAVRAAEQARVAAFEAMVEVGIALSPKGEAKP